jgi:hypothetical protein
LFGKSGFSRSNCASLNQNSLNAMLLQLQSMNHTRAALGTLFMGPEPRKHLTSGAINRIP